MHTQIFTKKEALVSSFAHTLTTFLQNGRPNLAKKVPNFSKPFASFLNQTHSIMETFFSLKTNKSPRYDDKNFNVFKKCFGEIKNL